MNRSERNHFLGFFKEEVISQEESINEAKRNNSR